MTFTHGMYDTRVYSIWKNMRQRCLNPRHPRYGDYGGRGITICQTWLDSFEAFYKDVGDPPPGLTLDRIDNDGPYAPDNVRWASRADQNRNQRSRTPKTCQVGGCDKRHAAFGWCHTHYYRWYRQQNRNAS